MRDVIVTTPKNKMREAAEEAAACITANGGHYFRTFRKEPRGLGISSKVFYVEDGYVRGYGVVCRVLRGAIRCEMTGRFYSGCHAVMPANSWTWVRPVPMRGFQGWRYHDAAGHEVVGRWLDPRPEIPQEDTCGG